jgi:hypothetical protein
MSLIQPEARVSAAAMFSGRGMPLAAFSMN